MRRSSTTAAPLASSSDASPSPKVRNSCERYTRGLAAITQCLEPLSGMLSDKASTGPRRWPTPLELSAPAKGVSSTQGRPTCPLRLCKRYPSPGLLLCGVWTSSAPCRRHPGATRTCGERLRVARRDDGHPVGHHLAEGVAAQRTGWAVSFSLAKSLGSRKPKREAGSRAKNHRQTLPRVYKDQSETVSTLRPDRPRDSKTRSKTVIHRTARGSRARNSRPANRTPRRINSTAGQAAPLAGEAGDTSPSP
jgi:hypothetical protein